MNFSEAVNYLYGLGYELSVKKFGLENTFKLLEALDNPEKNYLKIQIAGTNGKGSTCAFLSSICVSARIKTGLYTSPHLVSITERIKIDNQEISEADFARHATRIREVSEKLVERGELETVPTFFEQVTVIALSYFAEKGVEIAILETGIGGRFDATTAANAEIAAITPIDYDHQNVLGNSLTEIAAEKAAIIREGVKAVFIPQKEEAMRVILNRCKETSVFPNIVSCHYFAEDFPEISFKTKKRFYPVARLSLEGEHQRQNACLAIHLAEALTDDFKFQISEPEIIGGLESAEHKGRLEWSFFEDTKILFDGAHNVAGAKALSNYLRKFHSEDKITMVFGSMKDKDLSEIAEILFPLAENLILAKPDNPRSESVEELKKYAENVIDNSKIFPVGDVADAINSGLRMTQTYPKTERAFVCVTGSLYLVGEAQKILKERNH